MCNGRWIMREKKIVNLNEVIYCSSTCTLHIEMSQIC